MPTELHADLHRLADDAGVPVSYLAYGWVVDAYLAVRDAEAKGRKPALPGPQPLAQSLPEVSWTQGDAEYERCRAAVVRHGSTMETVINAGARRYVDGGGSLESQRSA